MGLLDTDRDYLTHRGYTSKMLVQESLLSIPPGYNNINNLGIVVPARSVGFKMFSMAGTFYGIQTVVPYTSDYMTFLSPVHPWIPALYGVYEDYDLMYRTGEAVLVEGIFDRVPFRRLFPERACFARLSKGMTRRLAQLVRRYVQVLYVAYDMDEAGEKGYESTKKYFPEIDVVKVSYPSKDPNALWMRRGDKATKEIFERSFL